MPVYPVTGKLAFKGEVPNGALVVFHADKADEKVPQPRGNVKEDGTFSLTTYDGNDGAPPGDYHVTVQWFKLIKKGNDTSAGPNVIPPEYGKPESSPWKVTVAQSKNDLSAHEITK